MKLIAIASAILAGSLLLSGCTGSNDPSKAKSGDHKEHAGKHYEFKGKVTGVDAAKSFVKLDHEEIAGLMKAMEMDYSVQNPKMLEGVKVGDTVHGHLTVDSGKYVIVHLEKQ